MKRLLIQTIYIFKRQKQNFKTLGCKIQKLPNIKGIVGPNNLWARPTCLGGVQRPKPKKVMALGQKYKTKNGPEVQPRTV